VYAIFRFTNDAMELMKCLRTTGSAIIAHV
jgi:hypothetical protein